MITIYSYTDYREYIIDFVAEKRGKNDGYSMRCAAQKCGVPSGTFTRIVNGTRGIGPSLFPKFISWLGLKHHEADYFQLLVKFNHSTSIENKEKYYKEILCYRAQMQHCIPQEKFHFFEQWYYVALYELVKIMPDISEPEKLGNYLEPPISELKTVKALDVLEKSGFIGRSSNGFTVTSPFLSTGDHWESAVIHAFQQMMCSLGTEALVRFPKSERDISTLSISLSKESFLKVTDVIYEAREKIREIERQDTEPEKVYQVNLQVFPLSRKK